MTVPVITNRSFRSWIFFSDLLAFTFHMLGAAGLYSLACFSLIFPLKKKKEKLSSHWLDVIIK